MYNIYVKETKMVNFIAKIIYFNCDNYNYAVNSKEKYVTIYITFVERVYIFVSIEILILKKNI